MTIHRLGAGEALRLRAARLRALRDSPEAFVTTWCDAAARSLEDWEWELQVMATLVAVDDGADLGMVRGVPHSELDGAGYLLSLWVAPESRRRGVGAALVNGVIDWAKSQGMNRMFLDVAEGNTPAIELYRRCGFTPTGAVSELPPPREHIRELQMAHWL